MGFYHFCVGGDLGWLFYVWALGHEFLWGSFCEYEVSICFCISDQYWHRLEFRLELIYSQYLQTLLIFHSDQRLYFLSIFLYLFFHFRILFLINLFPFHIFRTFNNNPNIRIRWTLHRSINKIKHLFINLITKKLIIYYFCCMTCWEYLPSF